MDTEAYDLQQRSPWKSNNDHAMQACHLCLSHKHHGMPIPIISQAGCTAFRMTGLVERIGRAVIKLYAHIQVPRGWIMPTLLMCHLLLPGGSNFQCTATRLMLWFWKLEKLFCRSELKNQVSINLRWTLCCVPIIIYKHARLKFKEMTNMSNLLKITALTSSL